MKAKFLNTLIIIVVVSGTAIIPLVGGASKGVEPLNALFLAFVSAIIAIQVVPAIMLLGCMLKAVFGGGKKEQENSSLQ